MGAHNHPTVVPKGLSESGSNTHTTMSTPQDRQYPEDVPTKLQPLDEGTYTLYTQASDEAEAVSNVQATADDLERAGVEASVEYVRIDIPEERCVVGEGAVHEVALIIEEDHMDTSEK